MSHVPKQGSPSVVVSVKPPSTSSDLSSLDGSDDDLEDGDTTLDGVRLTSNPPSPAAAAAVSRPSQPTLSDKITGPSGPASSSSHPPDGSAILVGGMEETHASVDPHPSAYRPRPPPGPRSLSSALSQPDEGSSPHSTTEPLPASPRSSPPPPPEAPPLATTSRIRPFPTRRGQPPPPPPPPPPQDDDDDDEDDGDEDDDGEDDEDDEGESPPVGSVGGPSLGGRAQAGSLPGLWQNGEDDGDSDLTPDEEDDDDPRQDQDDDEPAPIVGQLPKTSATTMEVDSSDEEGRSSRATSSRRPTRSPINKTKTATTSTSTGTSVSSNSKRPTRQNASPSSSSSSSRATHGRATSANGAPSEGAQHRPTQARNKTRNASVESSASSEGEGSQKRPSRASTVSRTPNGASSASKGKGRLSAGSVHTSGGSSKTSSARKRALSSASQQAGPAEGALSAVAEGKRRRADDEGAPRPDSETADDDEDADESMVDVDGPEGDQAEDEADRSGAQDGDEDDDELEGIKATDPDEDGTAADVVAPQVEDDALEDEEAAEDVAALDGEEGEDAEAAAEEDSEEQSATVPFALQHRQDAMEALTKIEITFARLRDRLHVERMEECLREEESLLDGSHPVLVHLQTRLGSLRERELTLSTRRIARVEKEYENVRKADVGAVWEWWRNGREELQRDMMADVMRKRRRVDREKRAVEGGRPKRPIPQPQPGALPNRRPDRRGRDPDMDDLLPGSYLNRPEQRVRLREEREVWGPRPGLLGLAEKGRAEDLELLGLGSSTRQQPPRPYEQPPPQGMMQPAPMTVHAHHHHHLVQAQQPHPHAYQSHQMHPQQQVHYAPPPPPPAHHHQPGPNPHPYQYRPRSPVGQPEYHDPAYSHQQQQHVYADPYGRPPVQQQQQQQQQHHRSQSAMAPPAHSRPTGRTLSGTKGAGMTVSGGSTPAYDPSASYSSAPQPTEPVKRRRTESPAVAVTSDATKGLINPSRLSSLSSSSSNGPSKPPAARNNSDPALREAGGGKTHQLSPSVLHPPPEPAMTAFQIGGGLQKEAAGAGASALGGFSFHGQQQQQQEGLVGGPVGKGGASGRD